MDSWMLLAAEAAEAAGDWGGVTQWDLDILHYIADNIQQDFLTPIMLVITHMAKAGIFWILLSAVLIAIKKTRAIGIACAVALMINVLACNVIFKPIIARPRPYVFDPSLLNSLLVPEQWDYSFPSGHTSASFATAGVLPFMKAKKRLAIPLLILAVLIGLSRLYVCVHYPTDVICGAILGLCAAFLSFLVCTKILEKKLPKKIYEYDFFKKKEAK